ncbi:MAG: dihydroorotate dehydrogenase electron transfer subunit [Chloroflexi bacterium]|jgi:dihydroorotate dehydrogenase electron transfer subunit|nr:dihydroorotate dehydrogenase electron transfer subunit [Chloroflexota bacterium]MBT7079913.1 dihydroorotate dehydrogenase electron transfer subunit [Chloroflexota bacterium]MBT7288867.1 dihydroorotate dehydrogenase electron transfer subunit [Chloroflexota bacterium]
MKQVVARVLSNKKLSSGCYVMWLEVPEVALMVKPGQFVMVLCRGEGQTSPLLRRPLSVHRIDGDRLALLYAAVGQGTGWLAGRKTGGQVDVLGPLGNGFTIDAGAKKLLLVGGGAMGIAPMIAFADEAVDKGLEVTVLQGVRNADLLYPQDELPSSVTFEAATEDGSVGRKEFVTGAIAELSPDHDRIYACGPIPMYQAIAGNTLILSSKPTQVCLEQMMACGWGVCYGCTIKTQNGLAKVCQDGPVFDINDVVWDSVVDPRIGRV